MELPALGQSQFDKTQINTLDFEIGQVRLPEGKVDYWQESIETLLDTQAAAAALNSLVE